MLSAFDAWWHANNLLLGFWGLQHVHCKAGWFEMFPRLCKVDRGCAAAWQVGLRGGYPGRRLVCSRASSIYWFKVSFLRGVSPRSTDLGDWLGSA